MKAMSRAARKVLGARGAPASDDYHITLDYPVRPKPRFGYDNPAHPGIEAILAAGEDGYREVLTSFLPLVEDLARVPLESHADGMPSWHNGWFQGLDAAALYCFLATYKPRRYIEVGSGWSTRWARRAVKDHGLQTTITSIDPTPRAEVDALCDRVVREQLEKVDLGVFDDLEAGDICFFDGSHRSFPNSDATVAFVEVMPRLKPGVLVHVHDIFLPWDYPEQLTGLYWSEQYLLAMLLLGGGRDLVEVLLPNFYVCLRPELHGILAPLWERFTWAATPTNGLSFWMRRVAASVPPASGLGEAGV